LLAYFFRHLFFIHFGWFELCGIGVYKGIAKQLQNDIKELVDANSIILEDINSIYMVSAIDYIINYHLTVNDSLHLYTALVNKNKIEEFISSDKNLNVAAEKEGLKVFNPEE